MFASAIDLRRTRVIGAAGSRFRACRITHSLAHDQAAIQIRAGAVPDAARDEPVQFVLDADGLDEFIAELTAIRGKIAANLLAGPRARGGEIHGH